MSKEMNMINVFPSLCHSRNLILFASLSTDHKDYLREAPVRAVTFIDPILLVQYFGKSDLFMDTSEAQIRDLYLRPTASNLIYGELRL